MRGTVFLPVTTLMAKKPQVLPVKKDVTKLNVKALPHVRILSFSDVFVRQRQKNELKTRIHQNTYSYWMLGNSNFSEWETLK